jgi:hypothetical protein
MTYNKQTWENDNLSLPLSASRLGHMEDGIDDADTRITVLEPRTQTIAYNTTITPDATAGNLHVCVATGNLTLNEPTGGTDGQMITVAIQASGATRTVSFQGGTVDPVVIPSGKWWVAELRYVASTTTWLVTD